MTDETPDGETDDAESLAAGLIDELDGEPDASDGSGGDQSAEADASDAPTETADDALAGTFVVTHADEDSAVLRDADTGQVHTLSGNEGLAADEVIEATVAPEPPMGVTYELRELHESRSVRIEAVREPPTTQSREIAADQPVGEVTRQERAGDGELHVLSVPESETESAVEDVLEDRETRLVQAARAGTSLVEVRSEPGVVAVRYLP